MRISDWSSDVCSSDLGHEVRDEAAVEQRRQLRRLAGVDEHQRLPAQLAAGVGALLEAAQRQRRSVVQAQAGAVGAAGIVQRRRAGMAVQVQDLVVGLRSEEHTSELQSLMRISYAVF